MLFRKVKFLDEQDMDFGSDVCNWVLTQYKLSEEAVKREFWYGIRKKVKKRMDTMRNNKSTAIKTELMGKFWS